MNTHQIPPEDGGHEPPDAEVLGVLDAAGRTQAQARIEIESSFAQRVQAWEQRFAGLLDEIMPVAASTHVWPRIRTQLGWSPVQGARPGLWQNLAFWRGATALAAAAAVAAVVIGYLPQTPAPQPPAPPRVVVVQPPGGAPQGVPTGPIIAKGNIQAI